MSSPFEPFKVDFSNFYKFVSSVGLVLIAAAAAVPWFVMKAAIPDADPKSEAGELIERAALTRAEQYLFTLQTYPWVSVSLFVLGIVLTCYGLIAWRRRQKMQDADEDETFRQRKELGRTTKASDEERSEKLDSEAANSEEAPDDASLAVAYENRLDGSSRALIVPSEASAQSAESRRAARERRDLLLNRIKQVETSIGRLLEAAFLETHDIESGVKVPADDGRSSAVIDFVARAKDAKRWTSFAIEVHVNALKQPAAISDLATRYTVGIAIAARGVPEGQIQRGGRGRPMLARSVSLSIVVVLADGTQDGRSSNGNRTVRDIALQRLIMRCAAINSVLARKVGLLTIAENSLAGLSPEAFHATVVALMENPDEPFVDPYLS